MTHIGQVLGINKMSLGMVQKDAHTHTHTLTKHLTMKVALRKHW